MNVFNSSDLTGRSAPGGWAGLFASQIEAMDFIPAKPDAFMAELASSDLGPLRMARLTCGRTTIERGASRIAAHKGRPTYLLMLQVRGEAEVSHYGKVSTLAEGDFVLCDSAAPIKIRFLDDVETLFLKVEASVLKEHLPSPECFCGRALRTSEGLTATATAMALNLFGHLEAGLSLNYRDRVARHLLDIVATAYALAFDAPSSRSSVVSGRCATVKLFIEQHLRDPELTPCSVAAGTKLSTRYLRMIFASENETVSAYILRRRLEQCARQIADPAWRGHSMTEIAFGWGFNSAPHFTRTFRDRFGLPPREYRRLKLEQEGGAFGTRTRQAARAA
ncbi:helix-turn-helix domain-containing protein [Caulobacter segnis]|uniref:AraC-like ligand-binding domain-containing protein n=1 Tax=Caulobacter segnis TaxID=88688 RepID=UPI001CBE0BBE|nr:helix-turn-helix domain-containing protein [Caulobacter segnis]